MSRYQHNFIFITFKTESDKDHIRYWLLFLPKENRCWHRIIFEMSMVKML